MNQPKKRIALAVAAGTLAAAFAVPAAAQQVTFMTGPQGGSWIPLGGALKGMWEQNIPGLSITQTPGAGIANVRGVDEGKAQIGLSNSNTAVLGVQGEKPYPKKVTNVCQLANLYPQYFQVVAAANAGVNSFADLKGKTLVTQPKGNTGELLTEQVLKINGMTYQSLAKVNFQAGYNDAVAMMKDGRADAFALSRDSLPPYVAQLPGSRIVDGGFQQTGVAIAVPKGRPDALAYVSAFLEEAKASGLVRRALDRAGLNDLHVAP